MNTMIRNLLGVSLFVLLLIFTNGCKKTANEIPAPQPETMKDIEAKVLAEGKSFTQIVNLPGKGYWADLNGKQLFRRSIIGARTTACPDPGEDYPEQAIHSVKREYTCAQGFRLEVKYDVTLAYTPELANNAGTKSFGRVRLKNGSTTIWPTTTPVPKYNVLSIDVIGSAGTDPNGLPLTTYRVTFRSEYIPESTFNASTTMETYLSVYTDCDDYPTFVIPYSSQQSVATDQANSLPCARIDKVYWGPKVGSTPPYVTGCHPLITSCFPSGYVFPHRQEIQFKNGSGSWVPFALYVNGLGNASVNTGLISIFDVFYIDVSKNGLVAGNVQVRYRNNHESGTGNGAPCTTAPDDTWVYETWYLN
ncbi:MAG TPA: hypothetical protein VMR70_20565 [Flavisolibacter sp.]|nr:hypothetical protein [Flavisolibacter sp.]